MSDTVEIRLLPHGGSYPCAPDQTLLDAAIAAGYWLPHSCRAGTCNSCHVDIREGSVRYAADATGVADIPSGQCRTCQAYPDGDVVLVAPDVPREAGQRVVTAGARVIDVAHPSPDVTIIKLQVPAAAGFRFKAGQYADVLLKDGAHRSYSMANAPNDDGEIVWHVRRMEGGRFSTHAYDKLKAKDLLRIKGPFGTFVLQDTQAPIVFLASGTGYAPIAALLETHAEAIRERGAVLYWGGRKWRDLYAVSSVAEWEAQHPGVRLVPVLSEADADWSGRTGLVHRAVLDDLPVLEDHEVYACGNPLMIDAARAAFVEQGGLPAEQFYCDAFVIGK